jgi:hypothetical protein
MPAQFRPFNNELTKTAMKRGRPPVGPAHTEAVEPGSRNDAERAKAAPVRSSHFNVQLQIVPEPRMTLSQIGPPQLLEAVDDRGNSLRPSPGNGDTPFGFGGMGFPQGGLIVTSSIELQRPETPGTLIKNLRGTLDVSVTARQSDPLVIPLAGAAGKTFHNDALHVVVRGLTRIRPSGAT